MPINGTSTFTLPIAEEIPIAIWTVYTSDAEVYDVSVNSIAVKVAPNVSSSVAMSSTLSVKDRTFKGEKRKRHRGYFRVY